METHLHVGRMNPSPKTVRLLFAQERYALHPQSKTLTQIAEDSEAEQLNTMKHLHMW